MEYNGKDNIWGTMKDHYLIKNTIIFGMRDNKIIMAEPYLWQCACEKKMAHMHWMYIFEKSALLDEFTAVTCCCGSE